MRAPAVSFVVPCYNLAHVLAECVRSILGQTFTDLEVLIMDDCSPDATGEVARSFSDLRVRHVRNASNLGHLRNYNKGIGMSRGRYVWLISADDLLLRNDIVERYVRLLDRAPGVGYAFCPGAVVGGGGTNAMQDWVARGQVVHGRRDRVFKGTAFLRRLLRGNTIVSASVLVRRECYERLGAFPLQFPWAGDWYLWCLFALHYDVAYFAQPMVGYRAHELNMTHALWQERMAACSVEEIAIPWAMKRRADARGLRRLSRSCRAAIAESAARGIASRRSGMSGPAMTLEQFEALLDNSPEGAGERARIRARVLAGMANQYHDEGDRGRALQFYRRAVAADPWMPKVQVKRLLLSMGRPGEMIWQWLKA